MELEQTLHIDASISDVWRDLAAGRISEAEAEHRASALAGQRPLSSRGPLRPIMGAAIVRRFAPRRYQCSPDREASRRRRRLLARGGHMPPDVRDKYREGEASALTIIAREI